MSHGLANEDKYFQVNHLQPSQDTFQREYIPSKVAVAFFKVIHRNSPGETEEHYEKTLPILPAKPADLVNKNKVVPVLN
jgi:hypothetical protein